MKLVHGWGINDVDYKVCLRVDDKRVWCPYYRVWFSMINRCYYEPYLQRYPTYRGCKVCSQWKYFSNFKRWMETQDWESKQLDKDFLGNGKLYSSETCCFVPGWLNKLFTDHGKARGKYPIGVYLHRSGRFQAQIQVKGRSKYLGLFDTPEEAHVVYYKAKIEYVQYLMKDYPDQRIREDVLKKLRMCCAT